MEERELIYEAKPQRTYTTDSRNLLIHDSKDDAEEADYEARHRVWAA
jgi:hypothetical protein